MNKLTSRLVRLLISRIFIGAIAVAATSLTSAADITTLKNNVIS